MKKRRKTYHYIEIEGMSWDRHKKDFIFDVNNRANTYLRPSRRNIKYAKKASNLTIHYARKYNRPVNWCTRSLKKKRTWERVITYVSKNIWTSREIEVAEQYAEVLWRISEQV